MPLLRRFVLFFFIVSCPFFTPVAGAQNPKDTLYQVSVIDALLNGLYDGETAMAEVMKQGDLGLGTLHALDGELLILDGTAYQITADGAVHKVGGAQKTPFVQITDFSPDMTVSLDSVGGLKELMDALRKKLPSQNYFYAIHIKGSFQKIKARSVPKQQRPYPPLTVVAAKQSVFEFEDVEGDIVGFFSPVFVKGMGVPGFHLHFLSQDKTAGGHLLDMKAESLKIALDETRDFTLILPAQQDYQGMDFSTDQEKALKKIER